MNNTNYETRVNQQHKQSITQSRITESASIAHEHAQAQTEKNMDTHNNILANFYSSALLYSFHTLQIDDE